MASTTIRVDAETHASLLALSSERGTTLMATVREATDALRRQRFGEQVSHELAALRSDESAWADYLAEANSTEIADGIRR